VSVPIRDYALIGDTCAAGLVAKNGSIDWLCLPRFDSGACFAALLGDAAHGRWQLSPPEEAIRSVRRRYRPGTLVLETEFTTADGVVRLVDCMPPGENVPNVVRLVEGVEGEVEVRMHLVVRFDYGWIVPWVRREGDALCAVGGPDALALHAPVEHRGEGLSTVATFRVRAGETVPFVLTWYPSHEPPPPAIDAEAAVRDATTWWHAWSSRCRYRGPWRDQVVSSLVVLKALTYSPTGGMVAAPTTSLPEWPGSVRNWDYRLCWLRDATFTLFALLHGGYRDEARAWRDWLLRAAAGAPSQLQALYAVDGAHRVPEQVLDWLPGYEGSRPVRIGNAAASQLQLDVYGEVMDVLHHARRAGVDQTPSAWRLQRKLLDFLESHWEEPDAGLWEMRSSRRHFTHSKVMAWVAFDRALKIVRAHGGEGPVDRWRALKRRIHEEVCAKAYDASKGAFTQSYGSPELDAGLLAIPLVGFLPHDDPRVVGTVAAVERELLHHGFLRRYRTEHEGDSLPEGEGALLLCSFWLADTYSVTGRADEARALFERLLGVANDVGLLAEEYDPVSKRLLGNFPQAYSHVGLVNTAFNLTAHQPTPAAMRTEG
jgi:GH15 family glucan-1,4-alpha-glucosidase